jgi:hypothetical protein
VSWHNRYRVNVQPTSGKWNIKVKHLRTATVSTTLDRIRTMNELTDADRTRMRQSSRRRAGIRWLLGLTLVMTAVPVEFGLNVCQAWPTTWIEGENNSILMAQGNNVYRSANAGVSWSSISTVSGGAGWFTRLSDNSLLLTTTAQPYGWVRSVDDGVHWSSVTSFGLSNAPPSYGYGPVIETGDGRWANCPYYEPNDGPSFHGQYTWSSDSSHQTWSAAANFPQPTDGNHGLTESTIARIGPNNYVAAIRADEGISGAWDGFYLSHSADGLNWTAPKPTATGEPGRMPLFYHIDNPGTDNDYWVLSYRTYIDLSYTSYAAARFSRDGQEWSEPYRFTSGVDTNPFFVESSGQWYLFVAKYPDRDSIIRMPIDLHAIADQLLPPAAEPSTLVLLLTLLMALAWLCWRRNGPIVNSPITGARCHEEVVITLGTMCASTELAPATKGCTR